MVTVLRPRVSPSVLEAALAAAWSRETSADPANWSEENRAWGQCAVTALIVQDYSGGTLQRGEVGPISHYWNVTASGGEVDLTFQQFPEGAEVANVQQRTREYVLSHLETALRYRRLSRRVDRILRGRLLAAS